MSDEERDIQFIKIVMGAFFGIAVVFGLWHISGLLVQISQILTTLKK